jgi:hypothetical protein
MYFYCLYGLFSNRLTGFSRLATIASRCPSAVLLSACEPIRAGPYSAPPVSRNYQPDHIPKPKATLNAPVSMSIEKVNRRTGESSPIGFANE